MTGHASLIQFELAEIDPVAEAFEGFGCVTQRLVCGYESGVRGKFRH
jgi:hypothetical protein